MNNKIEYSSGPLRYAKFRLLKIEERKHAGHTRVYEPATARGKDLLKYERYNPEIRDFVEFIETRGFETSEDYWSVMLPAIIKHEEQRKRIRMLCESDEDKRERMRKLTKTREIQ